MLTSLIDERWCVTSRECDAELSRVIRHHDAEGSERNRKPELVDGNEKVGRNKQKRSYKSADVSWRGITKHSYNNTPSHAEYEDGVYEDEAFHYGLLNTR